MVCKSTNYVVPFANVIAFENNSLLHMTAMTLIGQLTNDDILLSEQLLWNIAFDVCEFRRLRFMEICKSIQNNTPE